LSSSLLFAAKIILFIEILQLWSKKKYKKEQKEVDFAV